MIASKEAAVQAKSDARMMMSLDGTDKEKEDAETRLHEFLEAARKKLPTQEAYDREKNRKARYAKNNPGIKAKRKPVGAT